MAKRIRTEVDEIGVPEKIYFTALDGAVYRLYDVCYGPPQAAPGHKKVRRPPSGDANYRYFVTADGARRIYMFAHGESRELADKLLDKQLAAAGWAAREKFDASKHAPR